MGKIQLQKHERLVVKSLRHEGYAVEILRGGRGHRKMCVTKDGVSVTVTVSCTPSTADHVAAEVLRTVQQRMQERNTA